MPDKLVLHHEDIADRAAAMAHTILAAKLQKCYPIPRGGVPAAYMVLALSRHLTEPFKLVNNPIEADFFIDDIIDSGATMEKFCDRYPGKPFLALVDKTGADRKLPWVVFPWDNGGDVEETIEDNVRRLLQYIGEDVDRGGLQDTPKRVARAWLTWGEGYKQDPADVMKCFEDGSKDYNEMVVVKDIPFYSHCEHHLAPFFGTATIAYIPSGKVIGLSKLSRLLQIFARRLQVQERLTVQVADALVEHLEPLGVGVLIRARHLCMESRGVCQQGHHTITSALRGPFKDDAACRAEFMALCKEK